MTTSIVTTSAESQEVIFEQPLNETIRICLRLEQLMNQFYINLNQNSQLNNQAALIALVRALDVVDRPDIKSKITQILTQQAATLGQLVHLSQVDTTRLAEILKQLDYLIAQFHQIQGKIGERLRDNEFLNQIRLQLGCPGGICHDNLPTLALWLRQPISKCHQNLNLWSTDLTLVSKAVNLILHLTRESTVPQTLQAHAGYYQQVLNPNIPWQMIRIILPSDTPAYAAISANKHRLNVRFLIPDYEATGHAVQSRDDISFKLTCCRF